MKLLPGVRSNSKTQVCHFLHSLYKLMLAPHLGFTKFDKILNQLGFHLSSNDPLMFI